MNIVTTLLPVFLGGAFGYAWYKVVGCRTGACPLTSNPYISILYGGFLGFMLGVKG